MPWHHHCLYQQLQAYQVLASTASTEKSDSLRKASIRKIVVWTTGQVLNLWPGLPGEIEQQILSKSFSVVCRVTDFRIRRALKAYIFSWCEQVAGTWRAAAGSSKENRGPIDLYQGQGNMMKSKEAYNFSSSDQWQALIAVIGSDLEWSCLTACSSPRCREKGRKLKI